MTSVPEPRAPDAALTDALDLARALISRASVTPQDGGCQAMLAERLARSGFRCESMPFGEVANLWARRGTERPLFCFLGHTDVVPTGPLEHWTSDPFLPTVRDGRLYGRGAADMKSSIAAFVVAAEAFVAETPKHRGSVAILLTSDEEGPSTDGIARVVERLGGRDEAPDFCLVGEPTSEHRLGDTMKYGRRGSLSGRLRVRGVQGHIAYPHLALNPVHALAPALAELAATAWDAGDAHFPPTSWQVSNLHAGTGATNVIPGTVEMHFNFRFGPASPAADLRERLESALRRHALDWEIDWTPPSAPFVTEPGALADAVRQAVADQLGCRATLSTSGGTSDGRFMARICPQIVEFGPVNATIHKLDEHIALDELASLPRVYLDVLRRMLA